MDFSQLLNWKSAAIFWWKRPKRCGVYFALPYRLICRFSSSWLCFHGVLFVRLFSHSTSSFFITNLRPPIRKVGKSGLLKRLYAPALEICNASASCFASITSGMASNGSLLIKSPFPHEKAAATISVTAAASASVYLSKYFWYSTVT